MTLKDVGYNNEIQQAVAAEESQPVDQVVTHVLSSGVRIKFKKFSPLRVQAIVERFSYPEVPEVFDEQRGRKFRNPDHPIYQKMKAEVDQKRGMAVVDAVIVWGTELDFVPPSIPLPETNEWIDELELGGLEVKRESKLARHLAWIKFIACANMEDITNIVSLGVQQLGISEARVAAAMDTFPR